MKYTEELSRKIEAYLKNHPNATQVQLQMALEFTFSDWREAIKVLTDSQKVERTKGKKVSDPHTHRLIKKVMA